MKYVKIAVRGQQPIIAEENRSKSSDKQPDFKTEDGNVAGPRRGLYFLGPQNPMTTPQTFAGSWLQVQGGQTLTGPYKKPTVLNANVGSVGIVFQDASNATLTLPNGRQVAITRQRF